MKCEWNAGKYNDNSGYCNSRASYKVAGRYMCHKHWMQLWQSWEREADDDLAKGRYDEFADVASLLKDLHDSSGGCR